MQITCPSGRTVDYTRIHCPCEISGISTTFSGNTATLFENLTYRPFGGTKGMDVGNGGAVNNQFDTDGRMTAANPGATRSIGFTYDNNGLLLSSSAPNVPFANKSFQYDDPVYRLTHAEGLFGIIDYTYDDSGNRRTQVRQRNGQVLLNETYSYLPGTNRVDAITGTTVNAYGYDSSGNVTAVGTRSHVFDAENCLIEVDDGTNVLGQYTYNSQNERVVKTAGDVTTFYLYDFDGNLVAETDPSGNVRSEYIYRGGARLALATGGAIYFYHNDQLGTPELMTNASKTVVWEGIYDPFGNAVVNPASTVVNNFRFPGQYYDAETGYHYNHHRYYDPNTGRYLTPDPIGLAGGINPYVYVGNDPVNELDLDGLQTIRFSPYGRGVLFLIKDPVQLTPGQSVQMQEDLSYLAGLFNPVPLTDWIGDKFSNICESRRKNWIPDIGVPGNVVANPSGTTKKKYGPDGWVEKEWNKGHGPSAPPEEQDDHVHDHIPNPHHPDGKPTRQPGRKPYPGESF